MNATKIPIDVDFQSLLTNKHGKKPFPFPNRLTDVYRSIKNMPFDGY